MPAAQLQTYLGERAQGAAGQVQTKQATHVAAKSPHIYLSRGKKGGSTSHKHTWGGPGGSRAEVKASAWEHAPGPVRFKPVTRHQ
eukprot:1159106-Pelagomonas_calceolata.AAC.7